VNNMDGCHIPVSRERGVRRYERKYRPSSDGAGSDKARGVVSLLVGETGNALAFPSLSLQFGTGRKPSYEVR
jgi:hypothetical protein